MAAGIARTEPPLVVVVGPTASGKTALAIKFAKEFAGEIICADSRTIYKGMNIGTAKPTKEEQGGIPHWGLDLVEPGERFTVADFKRYALKKLEEIRGRGHTPFIVGGSGLYVDAVIFDYEFGAPGDEERRTELQNMSLAELHEYCRKNNIPLPENEQNKRYVIRAIEQKNISTKRRAEPLVNTVIVGIATNREVLRNRIEKRAEQIFEDGVVEEAITLGKKYGWENEAMTGNIYPLVHSYLEGDMTLAEIEDKFTTLDWRLAKRQLTWLKRNSYIYWGDAIELHTYITEKLANH